MPPIYQNLSILIMTDRIKTWFQNSVLSDVEAVYVDINDQFEATIVEAGDGRVNFSANLTSVIESFDATEFTVEADYGEFSSSKSFIVSTYKLPVLETTLLVTNLNENMNETIRFIDCAIKGKVPNRSSILNNIYIKKLVINQKKRILVLLLKMSLSRLATLNCWSNPGN